MATFFSRIKDRGRIFQMPIPGQAARELPELQKTHMGRVTRLLNLLFPLSTYQCTITNQPK